MENQGEFKDRFKKGEELFAFFNDKKLKDIQENLDTNTLKSLVHSIKVKCMINEHSFKEHISCDEGYISIRTVIGGEETGMVFIRNIYRHDDQTKVLIEYYTWVKSCYKEDKEHIKEKF